MSSSSKIVIIQLTRIGDLIQTIQATRQFKAENPEARLTLVARKSFAEGILPLIESVFENVILLETKDLFQKKTFQSGKTSLHNFIHGVNEEKFDLLINLSFSKSSSYLASLIEAPSKMGIRRNFSAEVVITDKWSQFIYSNVMNGTSSPFQLVDIYRYMLGCKKNYVLNSENTIKEKSIVLHPFASHKKKRWGMHKWNELIFKLSKELPEYEFHIVGGKEDTAEASRIFHSPSLAQIRDKIKIHAGEKSIIETYGLLASAELFIGHDSMVSHLASETLTPTIVLSLGSVRPHETTPYQENVINIAPKKKCFPCNIETSCELLPCHSNINFQAVSTIAKGLINKEVINHNFLNTKLTPFQLDTLNIYKSEYTDEGLELIQISNNYLSTKDVFREYYKIIWQYSFRTSDVQAATPQITKETALELQGYIEGVNYLYELYNFGIQFTNKIIDECEATQPNLELIREHVRKSQEIDKLCNLTKKTYPHLAGIIDFAYTNRANSAGSNIVEISKNNLLSFYDSSNVAAVLSDFIAHSIKPFINHRSKEKEL